MLGLDSGKEFVIRLNDSIIADRQDGMLCPCWQVRLTKQGHAVSVTSDDKGLAFFDQSEIFDCFDFPAAFIAGAILGRGGGGGVGHGEIIG